MMGRCSGKTQGVCLLAGLVLAVVVGGVAAAASPPGAAWEVAFVAQPTNLPLTGYGIREPEDQYVLVLTNTGKKESQGPVEVVVALPAGIKLARPAGGPGWACPTAEGSAVVVCSYGMVAGLDRSSVLTIPVDVTEIGVGTATATVSGGGAPTTMVARSTEATAVGGALPPFGFVDFSSLSSDASGLPDIQAGDHPFGLTAIADFPQALIGNALPGVRSPKAITVELPTGFTGDPEAAPRCVMVKVLASTCPPETQVGKFVADYEQGLFIGLVPLRFTT